MPVTLYAVEWIATTRHTTFIEAESEEQAVEMALTDERTTEELSNADVELAWDIVEVSEADLNKILQ